jgi:hypothetical protein
MCVTLVSFRSCCGRTQLSRSVFSSKRDATRATESHIDSLGHAAHCRLRDMRVKRLSEFSLHSDAITGDQNEFSTREPGSLICLAIV